MIHISLAVKGIDCITAIAEYKFIVADVTITIAASPRSPNILHNGSSAMAICPRIPKCCNIVTANDTGTIMVTNHKAIFKAGFMALRTGSDKRAVVFFREMFTIV